MNAINATNANNADNSAASGFWLLASSFWLLVLAYWLNANPIPIVPATITSPPVPTPPDLSSVPATNASPPVPTPPDLPSVLATNASPNVAATDHVVENVPANNASPKIINNQIPPIRNKATNRINGIVELYSSF